MENEEREDKQAPRGRMPGGLPPLLGPGGRAPARIVSPRGQTLMELAELGREGERLTVRGRLMARFPSLMYASPGEAGKIFRLILRPPVLGYLLSYPFLWAALALRGEVAAEDRRRAAEALDVAIALAAGALAFAAIGYLATDATGAGVGLLAVGVAQLAVAASVGSPGGALGAVAMAIAAELLLVRWTRAGLVLSPLAGVPVFAAYAAVGPQLAARGRAVGRSLVNAVAIGAAISVAYLLLEVRNVLISPGAAWGAVIALAFFAVFFAQRAQAGDSWSQWGAVPVGTFAALLAIAASGWPAVATAGAVVGVAGTLLVVAVALPRWRAAAGALFAPLAAAGGAMLWAAGEPGAALVSGAALGALGWGALRRRGAGRWALPAGLLAVAAGAAMLPFADSQPAWAMGAVAALAAGSLLGGAWGWRGRSPLLYLAGLVVAATARADHAEIWAAAGVALLVAAVPIVARVTGTGIATSSDEACAVALVGFWSIAAATRADAPWPAIPGIVAAACSLAGSALRREGPSMLLAFAMPPAAAWLAADAGAGVAAAAAAVAGLLVARPSLGEGAAAAGAMSAMAASAVAAGPDWWAVAVGGWVAVLGWRTPIRPWKALAVAGTLSVAAGAAAAPGKTASALALAGCAMGFARRWMPGGAAVAAALASAAALAAAVPRLDAAPALIASAAPAIAGLAASLVMRASDVFDGFAAASVAALVWSTIADGVRPAGVVGFALVAAAAAASAVARPRDPSGAGRRERDLAWLAAGLAGTAAHLAEPLGAASAASAAAGTGVAAAFVGSALPVRGAQDWIGLGVGGVIVAQGTALGWALAGGPSAASVASAGALSWAALALGRPRRALVAPATFGLATWAFAALAPFSLHLPRVAAAGILGLAGGGALVAALWSEGRLDGLLARGASRAGATVPRSVSGGAVLLALVGLAVLLAGVAVVLDPVVRDGVNDTAFRIARWFGNLQAP